MKKRKIILATMALLISLITCSYRTSVSKYISEKPLAIYYPVQYISLSHTGGSLIKGTPAYENGSSYDQLVLTMRLERNSRGWSENTIETYNVVPTTEGCNAITFNNTFNTPYNENDEFKTTITCDLTEVTKDLLIYFKINEQFEVDGQKETEFTYASDTNQMFLLEIDKYRDKYRKELDSDENYLYIPKTYDESDLGTQIKKWLINKGLTNVNSDYITDYINSYSITKYSSLASNTPKGLLIDPNFEEGYYKLKKTNLLDDYINTYGKSIYTVGYNYFYIPDNDGLSNEEIDKLFMEYVEMYINSDKDDINSKYNKLKKYVTDYIKDNSDVNNIIDMARKINKSYLLYQTDSNGKYIFIKDGIFNIISKTIETEFIYTNSGYSLSQLKRFIVENYQKINSSDQAAEIINLLNPAPTYEGAFEYKNGKYYTSTENYYLIKGTDKFEPDEYFLVKIYAPNGNSNKFSIINLVKGETIELRYTKENYSENVMLDILEDLKSISSEFYGNTTEPILIDVNNSSQITSVASGCEYNTNIGYVSISDSGTEYVVDIILAAPTKGGSLTSSISSINPNMSSVSKPISKPVSSVNGNIDIKPNDTTLDKDNGESNKEDIDKNEVDEDTDDKSDDTEKDKIGDANNPDDNISNAKDDKDNLGIIDKVEEEDKEHLDAVVPDEDENEIKNNNDDDDDEDPDNNDGQIVDDVNVKEPVNEETKDTSSSNNVPSKLPDVGNLDKVDKVDAITPQEGIPKGEVIKIQDESDELLLNASKDLESGEDSSDTDLMDIEFEETVDGEDEELSQTGSMDDGFGASGGDTFQSFRSAG